LTSPFTKPAWLSGVSEALEGLMERVGRLVALMGRDIASKSYLEPEAAEGAGLTALDCRLELASAASDPSIVLPDLPPRALVGEVGEDLFDLWLPFTTSRNLAKKNMLLADSDQNSAELTC